MPSTPQPPAALPAASASVMHSGRALLSPTQSLWLVASMIASFLAASSAPSPLYALYREAWGFSALMLTVAFASYAFALLLSLLMFGALSDHRGRREVILLALGIEFVSTLMFWQADSLAWLIAARVMQGLATGIATSVLSASLLDLDRVRGPLINSVAPMFGMALGALGTSALVQFAPAPTRLVFDVLLVLFAVQGVLAYFLPETVERRPGAWASMRPKVAVPAAARATLGKVLPVNTAQWALGGFYLSLGPTLARYVTGIDAPMIGGGLIATLVLSGAVAILWVRHRPPMAVLAGGAVVLAAGLLLTLVGMHRHSTTLFFVGTLIAGLGFGAGFNGSVRSLVPLVSPQERAALMSGFFVLSYLAFSLPAIAAGLSVGLFGLESTSIGYGIVLVATVLLALLRMAGVRRKALAA
ncbi:MFS transporter [Hylemonella gracilis]|uniref:Major facilitator superfamily transporter n=1 Tax=Hylemonella gracilis ATCC 19624 TaxID=887062 RepID=F3KTJ7_9BURK|nr:MFS transporter [Hylemonella gracilis]EGI76876.1 major facilitator superfamily transporter [Hylemonella gracilis ATCC 19624]